MTKNNYKTGVTQCSYKPQRNARRVGKIALAAWALRVWLLFFLDFFGYFLDQARK